jgi:hypothetical protein
LAHPDWDNPQAGNHVRSEKKNQHVRLVKTLSGRLAPAG